MAESSGITVVGSCNVDLITYLNGEMPRAGETVQGRHFQSGNGGKGANQATAAARTGAKVNFIGRIGNDIFGDQFLKSFVDDGVDVSHLKRASDPQHGTGTAAIIVDGHGENMIAIAPGANAEVSAEDVNDANAVIASSKVVMCQNEVPLSATNAALKAAHDANVPFVLWNPAPAPAKEDIPDDLLRYVSVLVLNETECNVLSGLSVENVQQAETAARKLSAEYGIAHVIVTLGKDGALIVPSESDVQHIRSAPVERVVDTTGAGDAFLGALAESLSRGLALETAVKNANAYAGISVQSPGTQLSYKRRTELPADTLNPIDISNIPTKLIGTWKLRDAGNDGRSQR